jgi:hypothetical protein
MGIGEAASVHRPNLLILAGGHADDEPEDHTKFFYPDRLARGGIGHRADGHAGKTRPAADAKPDW